MELHLPYPPTPGHMRDHAAHIVQVVRNVDGAHLDFSVESLATVDRILGGFHDSGDPSESMAETLFQFGAYIGEVFVRQAGGWWVTLADDHPMAGGWPMIELANGAIANPIGKAFQRMEQGPGDAIPYFYCLFVQL